MECPLSQFLVNWILSLVSSSFRILRNHHTGISRGNSLRMSPRLNFWFSFWPSCSLFYSAGLLSSSLSLAWSGHGCSPTLVLFPVKTILKILLDRWIQRVDHIKRPNGVVNIESFGQVPWYSSRLDASRKFITRLGKPTQAVSSGLFTLASDFLLQMRELLFLYLEIVLGVMLELKWARDESSRQFIWWEVT